MAAELLGSANLRFRFDAKRATADAQKIVQALSRIRKETERTGKAVKRISDDLVRSGLSKVAQSHVAAAKKMASSAKATQSATAGVASTTKKASSATQVMTRRLSRQERAFKRQTRAWRDDRTAMTRWLSKFGRVATQVRNFRTLRYAIGGAVGAVVSGFGFSRIIGQYSMLNYELERSSELMGGNIHDFQLFGQIAKIVGTDLRGVTDAAIDLNEELSEARINLGPKADAFKRLGIDYAAVSKLRPTDQLRSVSGTIAENIAAGVYDSAVAIHALREAGLNEQLVLTIVTQFHKLEEQLSTWRRASADAVRATADLRVSFLKIKNEIDVAFTEALANSADDINNIADIIMEHQGAIKEGIEFFVEALEAAAGAFAWVADKVVSDYRAPEQDPELVKLVNSYSKLSRKDQENAYQAAREEFARLGDERYAIIARTVEPEMNVRELAESLLTVGRRIEGPRYTQEVKDADLEANRTEMSKTRVKMDALIELIGTPEGVGDSFTNELGKLITSIERERRRLDKLDLRGLGLREPNLFGITTEGTPEVRGRLIRDLTAVRRWESEFFDVQGGRGNIPGAGLSGFGAFGGFRELSDEVRMVSAEYRQQIATIDALENASKSFVSVLVDGTGSIGDAITSFLRQLTSRLADSAIGGLFNNLRSFLGLPTKAPPIPVETRQTGGPVNAGQLYRVNEGGMEYFVPKIDGTILPANSRMSGGKSVTVNINNPNINANDPYEVEQFGQAIANLTRQQLSDDAERNGPTWSMLRGGN